MTESRGNIAVVAAVLAAALLLSGCDIVGEPMPLKPAENVGVDPTGETVETGTLPPDDAEPQEEPLTAARPTPPPQPPPAPAPARPKATQPSSAFTRTSVPTDTSPPGGVRMSSAGLVHHHRKRSGGDGNGD